VLVGSNRFTQFESINQEYFHDGQLEFLAPYWPDYTNSLTSEFVMEFREYFKTEPNQYSMQGYDVTYFFAKAIAYYGDDFRKCLNLNRGDLVQGNYFFVPQAGGGFVNEGLNVVSYTKDYRVVKKKDLKK
jgi:ABC-type branched-subunit amino acid transport system substrate-binding protein